MVAVWLVAGIIVLLVALWMANRAGRTARASGLPVTRGKIVYSDSGAWEKVAEPLFSATYGLSGKPDYVLQTRSGPVPIELKPLRRSALPYESDVMQLAAYCLLLEEAWQATPPYGLLRYSDKTFRIEWDDRLREQLLATLDEMRDLASFEAYKDGPLPTPQHDMTNRCRTCGYHYLCWPGSS